MTKSENIHFTKGLQQIPPSRLESFKKRLKKILNVKSDASISRHANALNRTPYAVQIKIGNEFAKMGVTNWKGKKLKKQTV
jgi:hypothetical protein